MKESGVGCYHKNCFTEKILYNIAMADFLVKEKVTRFYRQPAEEADPEKVEAELRKAAPHASDGQIQKAKGQVIRLTPVLGAAAALAWTIFALL